MNISTDSQFLNRIINDPSVFPFVSYGQKFPMDAALLLEDRRNVFLANESGGFLFLFRQEGIYEVHTLFLPDGRGAAALSSAKEAAAFAFAVMRAQLLVTFVEENNRATRLFAMKAGFRKTGQVRHSGYKFDELEYSRKDWVKKCQ
jgi:hypothetical protein